MIDAYKNYDKYTFCIFWILRLHIGHLLGSFSMRQFAQSRHKHTWPHGCIIISTFSIKHTLQPPVSRGGLSLSIVLFCRLSSSLSCSFSSLLSFAVWNQNKAASVANNNQKSSNNLKVIILYMITYLYTLYDVIVRSHFEW